MLNDYSFEGDLGGKQIIQTRAKTIEAFKEEVFRNRKASDHVNGLFRKACNHDAVKE